MVVSDSTILLGMLFIMNYFIVYKANKFAGNMVFALIGAGIIS